MAVANCSYELGPNCDHRQSFRILINIEARVKFQLQIDMFAMIYAISLISLIVCMQLGQVQIDQPHFDQLTFDRA